MEMRNKFNGINVKNVIINLQKRKWQQKEVREVIVVMLIIHGIVQNAIVNLLYIFSNLI